MYQAIVILAGGSQQNDDASSLPKYVKDRLDLAFDIYNKSPKKPYLIVSSSGTPHRKTFINSKQQIIYECDSMAQYLIDKYHTINPKFILREYTSYDTIGNAYFTKINHIDPLQITNFLVITSDFHIKRSEYIFNFVFGLDLDSKKYQIDYKKTITLVSQQLICSRLIKEHTSLIFFKKQIKDDNIKDLKSLHIWLFTKHKAYSTKDVMDNKKNNYNKDNPKVELY